MLQNFTQEIENTVQQFLDGVHTALPGIVQAFDPAKCMATVTLKAKYKKPDGETLDYPPVSNVPVVFPQVSNQQITIAFPVKPGDGCLVVLAEQSLEAWKAGGEANLDLKHDLTNAIAIPGLFRVPNATMQKAVSEDAIMLVNQQTEVRIKSSKVEIETQQVDVKADTVEIDAQKVHVTGEVVIDKELTVMGIKFTPHIHTQVKSGGDKSGPPQKG